MATRTAGCVSAPLAVAAVLIAAFAGWRWGDRVFPRVESWIGVEAEAEARSDVTPDVAQRAVEKVDALREREEPSELALGGDEVASVLRYAAPGVLPAGVAPPEIELADGGMTVSTRVAVDAFPPVPELERVLGILPDTVPVRIDGSLMPFGDEGAALVVHRIRVSGLPLPRRLTPRVLELLGRRSEPGLPPEAMTVPLPRGLRTAYIHSDSLILVAAPR